MATTQYRGSQAYNQVLRQNEYVNRNTGTLVVSLPLVQLRGITESTGLHLELRFTAGTEGLLGLPDGWGFGVPFVSAGKSVTADGKTFAIDPSWTDSSGYQSGLRYLNDHGQKFQTVMPPQPVPGGGGNYAYSLTHGDGSVSYFDAVGKLIAHGDLFGNMLRYSYTDPLSDVFHSRLARITDTFGQSVSFGYLSGEIVLTLPDGSKTSIVHSDVGVQRLVNQIGAAIGFTYGKSGGATVIGSVSYSTGMTTRVTHTGLPYLKSDGSKGTRAAVQSLVHTGPSDVFLDRSVYSYGTLSGGNTYTGFSGRYRMESDSDSLMDSNDTAYLYDVLEQKVDADGTVLAASRTFFDYLHNPVREHSYLVDSSGQMVEAHRNAYSYDIVTDMHARSVNMCKPVKTVHSVYDAPKRNWVDHSRAETSYSLYGNVVSSRQFDLSSGKAVLVGERTHSFVEASWGGEMPLHTVYADGITGTTKRVVFALTGDQKLVASATVEVKPPGAGDFSPYKTKSFRYDGDGRSTGWTLSWAAGHEGPGGEVDAVSESIGYKYDSGSGRLTTETTDANGNTRTAGFDVRLPTGPCLSQTKPGGATRTFDYDSLARVTGETDALGRKTAYAYRLFAGDGENVSIVTQANGYEVRTTYDAKGRGVKVEDNGDPTQDKPTLSRHLRSASFNALDLKASETSATGQTTQHAYDGLRRPVAVRDALGNEQTIVYDDIACTMSTFMNGDLRIVDTRDGLGNVVQKEIHADSGSPEAGKVQRLVSAYDGFGQVVSETHWSVVDGKAVQNSAKTFAYTPEGKEKTTTYKGTPEDPALHASKTTRIARDLNGNETGFTREVGYNGAAQPTVKSETLTYDPVGNLVKIVNQIGQVETLEYNADSELVRRVRCDGTEITYAYDAAGQVIEETCGSEGRRFAYLTNGRIESVRDAAGATGYEYSLDGTASKITYPDGRALTLTKDAQSRVTAIAHPDGTGSGFTYNGLNQVVAQAVGDLKLSNVWGSANHSKGVLLAQGLSGRAVQTAKFGYDGFGDNDSVVVTDGDGALMFSASARRDGWRNLVGMTLSSAVNDDPAVNMSKVMAYDGLRQLTRVTRTPSKGQPPTTQSFAYDGAANVVSRSVDGRSETFAYNALNQLTSGGTVYDTNGRMTRDVNGASYSFDDSDRLTGVALRSGKKLENAYNPEGALAAVSEDGGRERFYPLSGTVASVESTPKGGEPEWHTLLWSNQSPAARVSRDSVTRFASMGRSVHLHAEDGSTNALELSAYGSVSAQRPLIRANGFNWNAQYTDPVSELVYLRARWYSPEAMRFLSLDPAITVNRYAYGMGNPIGNVDALGESWQEVVGLIAGAIVGIAATVITGGVAGAAAAAVFGTESVAASVSAGALAGAVGSVAGDLTNAGISGQRITGERVGIDLLSGAIGGAVGAGLGGGAGRVAMRQALNAGEDQAAITRIGLITSGAVGGLTGAAASAGVTSIAYQQPFFSTGNIVGMVVGFGAGLGGGFLTSGAYLGKLNAKIIPVPIGENELHLIQPALDTRDAVGVDQRLIVMAPQPEAEWSANGFADRPGGYQYAMRLDFGEGPRPMVAPGAEESIDTIAGHGAGNTIFASVDIGDTGEPNFVRPITGRNFAKYLVLYTDLGIRRGPIKLMSCFGAFRNAQVIADALQRDVWAGYPELDRYSFTGWKRFTRR